MWGMVAAAASPAMVTVAADASSSGIDITSLIGSVVTPVIVIVLLLVGKLHTHGEVVRLEEEVARRDQALAEAQARDDRRQTWMEERGIPALSRTTLVLEGLDAGRLRRGGDG